MPFRGDDYEQAPVAQCCGRCSALLGVDYAGRRAVVVDPVEHALVLAGRDLLVRELGISDALDEKDPYNIRKAMGPAFQRGTSPAAFAGEHFEEEFEQQEDEVQELEGARMGELENL